jgi:hypothetical protein
MGGALDGRPPGIVCSFLSTGGSNVITATETGDVFGSTASGETLTYTFADNAVADTCGNGGNGRFR